MMALYILVPAIANIQFMIELFKNPAFTLASSGNMSGTAFLFSSAFLVFIWLERFYDLKGGISFFSYF